jgi:hypothetical protein
MSPGAMIATVSIRISRALPMSCGRSTTVRVCQMMSEDAPALISPGQCLAVLAID